MEKDREILFPFSGWFCVRFLPKKKKRKNLISSLSLSFDKEKEISDIHTEKFISRRTRLSGECR